MYRYRKVGRDLCCPARRSARDTLIAPRSAFTPRADEEKGARKRDLRCSRRGATVNADFQPHISQHQAHVHATALQGVLLADKNGPKHEHLYDKALRKAAVAAERLTADEVRLLTNGLPRYYRHKAVPAAYIESAFDGGMLTLHEIARTNKLDLNHAVRAIGEAGQLQKALRLVEHLIKFQKANQHTLASFFRACLAAHRPIFALQTWERWVPTGLMGQISASAVMACAAAYDADTAVKVLFRMEHHEIRLHKFVYHHVMTALASAGDTDQVLMIWHHMDENLASACAPDKVTVQILLRCVCAKQQLQHVQEIFSEMLDRRIVPDSQLAATFIKAFSWAGDVAAAQAVFSERLPDWGITPDVFHYNALMYGHAKAGDWAAVDHLTGVLIRVGISPDAYTVVAQLTTVARAQGAAAGINEVLRILTLKETYGVKLNKYICGAFIQALRNCADAAPAERCRHAETLLAEAAAERMQLNAFVMNAMIGLYWESFEYKKAKKQYDAMIEMEIMPTYYTCDVMSALCAEVGWEDEAAEFKSLQQSLKTTDEGAEQNHQLAM